MSNRSHLHQEAILALLLLCISSAKAASPADNIVTIDVKSRKITEVYGAYLSCGLVVTDAELVKPGKDVSVTFYKGKNNELTVRGTPIAGVVLNFVRINQKKAGLPKGFAFPPDRPFKVNQPVQLWSYVDGFSKLDSKITEIARHNGQPTGFLLPGYLEGTTGCIVTTAKGGFAGIVVVKGNGSVVIDGNLVRNIVNGIGRNSEARFISVGKNGCKFKARLNVFDPLSRLGKVSVVLWTGPYYVVRETDSRGFIVPRMPGDNKPQFAAMKKNNAGAYECEFTTRLPHELDLFVGFAEMTSSGKVKRIITGPATMVAYRYFADAARETKGFVPYTKGDKPPAPAAKPPAQPPEFPAVDMKKVDPKSFFPIQKGNEWTYQRTQKLHAIRRTDYVGGRYSYHILDDGKTQHFTGTCRSGSTHTETYRIEKTVGDRGWLKIYSSLAVGVEMIRDSRYEKTESAMLAWRHDGPYTFLTETNKCRDKGRAFHAVLDLVAVSRKDLATLGTSSLRQSRSQTCVIQWTVKNLTVPSSSVISQRDHVTPDG